jgi:hypothetical protein
MDAAGEAVAGDDAAVGDGAPGGSDGGGEVAGAAGDDQLFVPAGLPNLSGDGQDVGLTLVAFTLAEEPGGLRLYAAIENRSDTPSCQAGMSTDFYDKSGVLLTSTGSVLLSGRFYRMTDGTLITCIDPGQVAMTASNPLPAGLAIDQLGHLEHLFPAFTVPGVVPVAGLTVSDVHTAAAATGTAYTGTLGNGLDVTVTAPTATIFPVNRVGRPLGVATASGTSALPPGATWTFTTSAVADVGVAFVAYPTATLPN